MIWATRWDKSVAVATRAANAVAPAAATACFRKLRRSIISLPHRSDTNLQPNLVELPVAWRFAARPHRLFQSRFPFGELFLQLLDDLWPLFGAVLLLAEVFRQIEQPYLVARHKHLPIAFADSRVRT